MAVTHATTASGTDSGDGEIHKAEWNANHTVADGSFVAAKLSASATDVVFGRSSAGSGNGQEIAVTATARSILDDTSISAVRATLGIAVPVIGYVVLKDVKTANTAAGGFTSGAWQTRVLNTEETDTNSDCSLASNQFTLAAGTYDIEASAPALFVSGHQTRLYNTTDSATILPGTSEYAPLVSAADGSATRSYVIGRFTIAASKALEIQHRCLVTRATNGFGAAANFGESEVYAIVRLWRVS